MELAQMGNVSAISDGTETCVLLRVALVTVEATDIVQRMVMGNGFVHVNVDGRGRNVTSRSRKNVRMEETMIEIP